MRVFLFLLLTTLLANAWAEEVASPKDETTAAKVEDEAVPVETKEESTTTNVEEKTVSTETKNETDEAIPAQVKAAVDKMVRSSAASVEIRPSGLPSLYEAVISGHVIYVSTDGEHVIVGDIRHLDSGVNVTEERRNGIRAAALADVPESKMVVFSPEGETKHAIYVFTDVDCPYCSKLHNEVPKLNEAGIKVRYLAFPRAGFGSGTYNTMVSVWCAKDQKEAMTKAKNREPVETTTCANPILEQYRLGQRIGVSGTPAIVLESGEIIGGYVPANKLIAALDERAKFDAKIEITRPKVAK